MIVSDKMIFFTQLFGNQSRILAGKNVKLFVGAQSARPQAISYENKLEINIMFKW